MSSIRQWLESLELGDYASAFEAGDIDWALLPDLDHDVLKDLGVESPGHRLRILKAARSLRDAPQASIPEAPSQDPERRQLTVLFADLVGSTALSGRLDPEDLRDVMAAYQGACKLAVERYDGYVARYMGDGLLAYFGFPQAHEDDAERAVTTGLDLVEAMMALNAGIGNRHDVVLSVRVGIATGLVVVGDVIGEGASREHAVVGETPNLAARLQALARPDSVVVAPTVHRLTEGRFRFQDLGEHDIKGIETAVQVWRVLGRETIVTRFEAVHAERLTPLVGREEELGILRRRWQDARNGDGQVALIVGEPGLGKSRLCEAFTDSIRGEPCTRIEYQCSPHHVSSALHPVIAQLERAAGLRADLRPDEKLQRLDALLAASSENRAEDLAHLAALLSISSAGDLAPLDLDAGQQKQRTLDALVNQIVSSASRQPVLCIFEDAHWIDPTTFEFLDCLGEQAVELPILVLVTFRPEFEPPWIGQPHATLLAMKRLPQRHSRAMVDHLAHGTGLPSALLDEITTRTDGVPLFIEELIRALADARRRDPAMTAERASLEIPETLRDSLMARLDRLIHGKAVAQVGAAIGREFSRELLERAAELDSARLDSGLSELVESGLVIQRGSDSGAQYFFKHALIRDAAYESMLTRTREQVHARIAKAYEAIWPERISAAPELMAHHLECARLNERAVDYWLKAGQRALALPANKEAIEHTTRGLGLLDTLADDRQRQELELNLRITFGPAVMALEGYGSSKVKTTYERAYQLSDALDLKNSPETLSVLYGLRRVYTHGGQLQRALQIAEQTLELAQILNDEPMRLYAEYSLGMTLLNLGEAAPAQAHFEIGAQLSMDPSLSTRSTALHGVDVGPICDACIGYSLWAGGYPDQAARKMGIALERARARLPLHPFTLAHVMSQATYGSVMERDANLTLERADECIAYSNEHGFPLWIAWATSARGWALALLGEPERGVAVVHQGLAASAAIPTSVWAPFTHGLLAEALLNAGCADEAMKALNTALDVSARTGENFYKPDLYRLQGEALLQLDEEQRSTAQSCFEKALDIARVQQARSLELRAATSLARLLAADGQHAAARDRLGPVYSWFSEGFGSKDLVEAKTLLDTLH